MANALESVIGVATASAGIFLAMLITPGTTLATESVTSQICAARDVKALILIEDHGEANDIAAGRLAEAGLMQMQARIACKEGRAEEGIAIYDEIIRSLGEMLQARP
jgi:hypothetical protein